ncbi:MAG: DUF366 family protein [Bacillota bacterium]
MVHTLFAGETISYDGSQLSSLWAFKRFRLQGDSIVAFRGPCEVKGDSLVDMADRLQGSFIYSPDMLHFIAEHFENDLGRAVLRQRFFAALVKEILEEELTEHLNRQGDDLFAKERKLSVSIATVTPVSTMFHFGINIRTEGVPVAAVGLLELGWPESKLPELALRMLAAYSREMEGVDLARCKVRGVP